MNLTRAPRFGSRAARAALVAIVGAEVVAAVVALVVVSGSSSDAAPSARSSGNVVASTAAGTPSIPAGTRSSPGSSPAARTTTTPSTTAQVAELVAWMRRALPASTPVLADAAAGRSLRAAGLRSVAGPDAPSGARFVLATPALAAAATTRPALAPVLARSVPVAAAGGGAGDVTVRQVAGLTAAQLAAAATTRRSAENELLANGNLTVPTALRSVLRNGGVDLRAAAVLALVASTEPVTLVAVQQDPAEAAAGRPARVIDLRTGSASGLRDMLLAVAPAYRVASVSARPGGVLRLTWPVDVTSGGTA